MGAQADLQAEPENDPQRADQPDPDRREAEDGHSGRCAHHQHQQETGLQDGDAAGDRPDEPLRLEREATSGERRHVARQCRLDPVAGMNAMVASPVMALTSANSAGVSARAANT